MRADAKKNTRLLREAAADCFRELGLTASIKEISRRAGVSPGTLYNLYGSREGLIDAVMADVAGTRVNEVIAHADLQTNPWDALAAFIEGMCELQATDPAISDILMLRCPSAPRIATVFEQAQAAGARYIEHAHQSGELRSDFVLQDLFFIFGANAIISRATEAAAPDRWRRGVALFLQGLRATAQQPLPASPLTPEQLSTALTRLATVSVTTSSTVRSS